MARDCAVQPPQLPGERLPPVHDPGEVGRVWNPHASDDLTHPLTPRLLAARLKMTIIKIAFTESLVKLRWSGRARTAQRPAEARRAAVLVGGPGHDETGGRVAVTPDTGTTLTHDES